MRLSSLYKPLDRFNHMIGRGCAWLLISMMMINGLVVVLRYGFNTGFIALQESLFYQHACVFFLVAAMTLSQDKHIRIDIFYRRFSKMTQIRINLLGICCFLWPLCYTLFYLSWPYVALAWRIMETSAEPGGIPLLYLLKSLLLVFPILLALQGFAEVCKLLEQYTLCRSTSRKVESV